MDSQDFAGIVFDFREPIPPELLAQFQLQEPCPVIPPQVDVPPFARFVAGGGHDNNNFVRAQEHRHQVEEAPVQPIQQQGRLPPLSTSLVVRVVEDAAKVTVTQLFQNTENTLIHKGAYTFPLPTGCTVTDFSCRVGRNRVIRAKVKPKQEAREAFDRAIRNDQTAALLEQDTPEIFTTTLGRIPPSTKLKAELSFVMLLKHKFEDGCNRTTLTIPTNIASRYGTPLPEFQGATPSRPLRGLKIEVEVVTGGTVQDISSDTHNVIVEHGVGRRQYGNWEAFAAAIGTNNLQTSLVELADDLTYLNRDFVLNITTHVQGGMEMPHAVLEEHPSFPNHKAIMLTIPQNFMLNTEPSSEDAEILFVADRSGSMVNKMQSVTSAMGFFLKGIPEGRKFNIWCFGSSCTALWNCSRSYSAGNLTEALTYVQQRFVADMGGTELLPALKKIVTARDPSRHTEIVVLTDGEVWSLNETIEFVRETKTETEGKVRFFALGIGDAVSHELVEGIAKAGGGYAEVIPAASQGGWEDRVVSMLRSALKGHLGPIQIDFDTRPQSEVVDVDARNGAIGQLRPPFLRSPADVSVLSPFLRNRIFFLFDSRESMTALENILIKYTPPGGSEIDTVVRVQPLQRKEIPIHKLAVRALLGDLERGQSWIHLGHNRPLLEPHEEANMVRCEGEQLAVKWSLVSKWTSFYAVEEPYQLDGNAQDPFLDADDVRVREVNHDPGLLRPRGTPARRLDDLIPTLENTTTTSPSIDHSQDDEDDDTISDSESSDHEGDGDARSASDDTGEDDDDEDDNDNGPPGGGSGAAAGDDGNIGGGPQSPSRHGGGRPAGTGVGGAQGNNDRRSGNESNPDSSARDTANQYNTEPATQQGTEHEVTYERESRPKFPGNYPRLSRYTAATTIPSPLGSIPPVSQKESSFGGHKKLIPGDKSLRYDRLKSDLDVSKPKVDTSPPLRSRWGTFASSLTLPKLAPSSTLPTFTGMQWSMGADDSDDDIVLDHSDKNDGGDGEIAWPELEVMGGVPDSGRYSTITPSSLAPKLITAPSFNPPASVALTLDQSAVLKTDQQREGEELVSRLLQFQGFDGSFDFGAQDGVKGIFGDEFGNAVDDLARQPSFRQLDKEVVTIIAVVAFLELKFQLCKDLWALMVSKSRYYVKRRLRKASNPIWSFDELCKDATARLLTVRVPSAIPESQTGTQPEAASRIATYPSAIPTLADSPGEKGTHVSGTGTFQLPGADAVPKPAPAGSLDPHLQSAEVAAPTETGRPALAKLAGMPEQNQVRPPPIRTSKETKADATPLPALEPLYQTTPRHELAASTDIDRAALPGLAAPPESKRPHFSSFRARFARSPSSKGTEANTSPRPNTTESTSQAVQRSNVMPPGQERLGSLPFDEW